MSSAPVNHCPSCGAYMGYDRSKIHEHPCSAFAPMPPLPDIEVKPVSSAAYRNTEDGLARYRRGIR